MTHHFQLYFVIKGYFKRFCCKLNSFIHQIFIEAMPGFVLNSGDNDNE